jgi:hypothetical protein
MRLLLRSACLGLTAAVAVGCAATASEQLLLSGTVLDQNGRAYNRCQLTLEEPMSEGIPRYSQEFSTGYFRTEWTLRGRGTFVAEVSCIGSAGRWRSAPFEAGGGIGEVEFGEIRLPRA